MRSLIVLATASITTAISSFAVGVDVSHGRQVILNRGLQIQGLAFTSLSAQGIYGAPYSITNQALWSSANFTTVNFWNDSTDVRPYWPAGTAWGRWGDPQAGPSLPAYEQPYASSLVSMQYGDEVGQTQSLQDTEKALYAAWNTSNTLAYTNFYAGQVSTAQLTAYMQYTKPDMLMFDNYPGFAFSTSSRNTWYSTMQTYRTVALAGYDGNGTSPIPYAQFLDLYRSSYSAATPSESFVRLQQNASWAFGYSMVSAFVYDEPGQNSGVYPVMFNQPATGQPTDSNPNTTEFNYVAEANRQSRNLGPALVRLVSTDIRMIPGSNASVSGTGLTQWNRGGSSSSKWNNRGGVNTGGYSDYLTSITPTVSQGGATATSYSDILIGYFKPLLADNSGATFVDGLHFMIVNGASQGTAAASAQWYHLTFNFSGSAFNELVRLSRDTGKVEAVSLTPTGGSNYYLDLNLPGGTGDLFAFWNSAHALSTIPEPGTLSLLFSAALASLGILAWFRRRRVYHV